MSESTINLIILGSVLLSLPALLQPGRTMFLILALSLFTGPVKMLLGVRESPLILDIALITALFSFVVHNHILNNKIFVLPRLSLPILFLLMVSFIQIFNSTIPNMQVAMEGFRLSAFYMIAFFTARYTLLNKKDIKTLMTMIVFCSFVAGIYGIRQHYYPFEAEIDWAMTQRMHMFWGIGAGDLQLKVFSTFNGLGAHWLFIPLFLLTHITLFFLTDNKRNKFLIVLSLIIVTIASLFSMGRAAWISSFIGIAVLLLLLERTNKIKLLVLIGFILITGFLAIKKLPKTNVLADRFQTFRHLEEDRGVMARFDIMQNALQIILENPLGRGVGTTSSAIITRYEVENIAGHNQFLNVALELGILPMFVYIYIVLASIWIGFKIATRSPDKLIRITAALLLAYNIAWQAASMEGASSGFPQSLYYWFLLGALVNLKNLEDDEKKEVEKIESLKAGS